MTTRYVAGPGLAVVRGGVGVLLPVPPTVEVEGALWDALGAGAGVVDVIQVLAGTSPLREVPDFAVAVVDADGAHVAVRGAMTVTISPGDDEVVVSGAGTATWAERRDESSRSVVLRLAGAPTDAGSGHSRPVDAAAVVASVIELGASVPPLPQALPVVPAALAAPVVPAAPTADAASWVRTEPAGAGPADAPGTSAAPAADDVPDLAEVPEAPEAPEVPEVAVAAAAAAAAAVLEERAAPEVPVARGAAPGPSPAVADDEIDGFTHLWGATVRSGVESAAVRPVEDDDASDLGEPTGGTHGEPAPEDAEGAEDAHDTSATIVPEATSQPQPNSQSQSQSQSRSRSQPQPGPDAAPALVAGVPRSWSGTGSTEPGSSAGPIGPAEPAADRGADDPDESTVHSSVIAALRASSSGAASGAGAAPSAGQRPQILAGVCAQGHANPPTYSRCAACGDPLEGASRTVDRPVLGRVELADGRSIDLDRPLVVGRRPRSPRSQQAELARLVTVESPEQDISRSHVEVRLEGWHVLAEDLGTTNGTVLVRQGQPPRRLHPGVPEILASGDVVDLGDGVTLTLHGIL